MYYFKNNAIAEGVETKEQLEFLCRHDCEMAQGYFIHKPAPKEVLSKTLGKNK